MHWATKNEYGLHSWSGAYRGYKQSPYENAQQQLQRYSKYSLLCILVFISTSLFLLFYYKFTKLNLFEPKLTYHTTIHVREGYHFKKKLYNFEG